MTEHVRLAGIPYGPLHGSLEHKDAGGGDDIKMTPELKKIFEDLQKGFKSYREKNDEAIAEVKKNGVTDVILKEHIDRLDGNLDKLQKRLDDAVLEAKRPIIGHDDKAVKMTAEQIEHAKAFMQFFRKGSGEHALAALEEKALSAGSNPDGGYLVPVQMETAITRVVTEISPVRSVAQVLSVSSPLYKKPINLGGANSGWVSEAGSRPQTNTPTLSELSFPAHEMYAMPAATQTILDDANISMEEWLAGEVRIEFARAEGAAFVVGDGVGKPRGFMAYDKVADASYAWGKTGYIATGGAGFSADPDAVDDFIDVVYALKGEYRVNARWAMNRATMSSVRKFRDGDDNYIWQPSIQVGQPAALLGYPIAEMESMAAVGDGNYPVAFADFRSAYLIVDRVGVRILRDPFTAKPYVLFYTTKRVGGGIQNFEAIKLLRTSAS